MTSSSIVTKIEIECTGVQERGVALERKRLPGRQVGRSLRDAKRIPPACVLVARGTRIRLALSELLDVYVKNRREEQIFLIERCC